MEDILIMTKGQQYQIKTLEIQDGKKPVGTKYKYFIVGEDKKGMRFKAEYLCPATLDVTDEFPIGVMRWVKCTQVSPQFNTPSIDICEDPAFNQGSIKAANAFGERLVGPADQVTGNGIPYLPNCYSANIQGLSITFSTAYAKDLLMAEISRREDPTVTDEDVERMMGWAHVINDKICERIKF